MNQFLTLNEPAKSKSINKQCFDKVIIILVSLKRIHGKGDVIHVCAPIRIPFD